MHSVVTPFHLSTNLPDDTRYGATRAHNRSMSEFVANDSWLMGVVVVSRNNPKLALVEVVSVAGADLEAAWALWQQGNGHRVTSIWTRSGSAWPAGVDHSFCTSEGRRCSSILCGRTPAARLGERWRKRPK